MIRTGGPASAVSNSRDLAIATKDLGCRMLEAGAQAQTRIIELSWHWKRDVQPA